MKSLYCRLKEEGIEIVNHYSDLYFPVNSKTTQILREEFPEIKPTTFVNQITKTLWYDAPFKYEPYWEE